MDIDDDEMENILLELDDNPSSSNSEKEIKSNCIH